MEIRYCFNYLSPTISNIGVNSGVDENTFQVAERGQLAVSVQGLHTTGRVKEFSADVSRCEPNMDGDGS